MMAAVACLLLWLSCSIAGQATPTSSSSLAMDWQTIQGSEKATGHAWPYNDRIKTSPVMGDTAELDEVLVKRTSRSPSYRRWSPPAQGTGMHTSPPTYFYPGAPVPPHILGGDHSRWLGLSTATPSQLPEDAPLAPHSEAGSSSMWPNKAKRRPPGTLKSNPALKAQANRDSHTKYTESIRTGERANRTKPDGSKYEISTVEEFLARKRANARRSYHNLKGENRTRYIQKGTERRRRARERQKAQQEGRIWQGSPVRKPGRPRRNWEQEQAGAQEARQHAPAQMAVEEAVQPAVLPGQHGSGTLRLSTPESLAGSSSLHAFLHGSPRQVFPAGPFSSSPDLRLSLSAPGSSPSELRHATHAPQQGASLPPRTREEDRLGLTLAPPGEHVGLRLTLAQPRYD